MAGDGTPSGFSSSAFRDAVHFAMNMGIPEDPSLQAIFVVPEQTTYTIHDTAQDPYDWGSGNVPVTDVAVQKITVPCAVAFAGASIQGEPVGEFSADKL